MAPHKRTTKFAAATLGLTGVAVAFLPGLGLPGGSAMAASGRPGPGTAGTGVAGAGVAGAGVGAGAGAESGSGRDGEGEGQYGAGSRGGGQHGSGPYGAHGSGARGVGAHGAGSHGSGPHGSGPRGGGWSGPGPAGSLSTGGPAGGSVGGPTRGSTGGPSSALPPGAFPPGALPSGALPSGAPRSPADQAKAQIAQLYQQAEVSTQAFDAAQEQIGRIQSVLSGETSQAQQLRTRLATLTTGLGRLAAEQYRSSGVDPSVTLMFAAHPDNYLAESEMASQNATEQDRQLSTVLRDQAELTSLDALAGRQLADLRTQQASVTASRAQIQGELSAARHRLDALTSSERVQVTTALANGYTGYGGNTGDGLGTTLPARAPSLGSLLDAVTEAATGQNDDDDLTGASGTNPVDANRVLKAVSTAYSELGKPYVWGATGPDDFDCSGLTQHVWAAAGVALPRTSEEQADIGAGIPISQIQPGDLVIYFSGRTHVGVYVGQGLVIHAPRPGSVVQFAALTSMPINKIVRPTG